MIRIKLFYLKVLPKYPNYAFYYNKKLEIGFQNVLKTPNSLRYGFMLEKNDFKTNGTNVQLAPTSLSEGIWS